MTDRTASSVQRIVVVAPNWLGDAVLALPALAGIRVQWQSAHLTVAGPPAIAALFREDTDAAPDEVLVLDQSRRASTRALAAGRFDLAILLPNSFHSAWRVWRAGIRDRWGYATAARGPWLTRRSRPARADRTTAHHSDYFRALVRGLGIACDDRLPRLAAKPTTRSAAAELLAQRHVGAGARLVGLAPGAAYGQAKQWPPDRVAALAADLVRTRDVACLVVGAAHDQETARAIESWLRARAPREAPRVIDLTGRTTLGTLTAVLERCDVIVSNDSGAMHVAAATGRPVVAVFGPTNEHATRPLGDHDVLTHPVFCRPCMLRDCPIDHRCMTRITVAQVFDAVAGRLARAADRRTGS